LHDNVAWKIIGVAEYDDSTYSDGLLDYEQWNGATADNTLGNEIRPLFALVKLAPPLHKHYLYPIKYIQYKPLMSCLFIKSTFSQEIIYSIITTYQIWLTGYRFRPMGILRCAGNAYFVSWCVVGSPSFPFACPEIPAERRDRSQSNGRQKIWT
jgi:hypothetical protein